MICAVCSREAKGFGWGGVKRNPRRKERWLCSMQCQDICHERKGMIDPTKNEIDAIMAASDPAGQFIESLPTTDMAKWSQDQWFGFLECVVTAFQDSLRATTSRAQLSDDEIPF